MADTRILVVHQGAIGDFVLSLPALQTIKNSFPGRATEMLGYPGILSLVSADIADTIRSVDWAPASTLYGDSADVSPQMRQYLAAFERVFVFSSQEKSACFENVRHSNAVAFYIRTFPDAVQHVVDYQLAQLAAMGFKPAGSAPHLCIRPGDRCRADNFLQRKDFDMHAGPLIAVHAGSGGRHKCWPAPCFCAVMQRLHEKKSGGFLIVQGPADQETDGNLQAGLAGLPHEKLENIDLPLVAALLSRCVLFVGNDSGITHMAAALGIPTVAVFGPTDPAVWGPRGKSVRCVRGSDPAGGWRWPEPATVLQSAISLLGG